MVLGLFQQQPLVNNCQISKYNQPKVSLFLTNYLYFLRIEFQLLLFNGDHKIVIKANEKTKDE